MRVVRHSVFLPATPARIPPLVGAEFSPLCGRITGRIIARTPERQMVQTWRSFEWRPEDPDSILLLTLQPESAGTRLDLLQANWPMRYLDPWRAALEDKERK